MQTANRSLKQLHRILNALFVPDFYLPFAVPRHQQLQALNVLQLGQWVLCIQFLHNFFLNATRPPPLLIAQLLLMRNDWDLLYLAVGVSNEDLRLRVRTTSGILDFRQVL